MAVVDQFQLNDFSADYGTYFPAGNFLLYARHYEFYIVGCWLFLYSVNIHELCCVTVKLLGNSLILWGLVFKIH